MTAVQLVDHLLESDLHGPPAPDNFTNAMGTMQNLMSLERKKLDTMQQLGPALGIERQLRKHGITRDQVAGYIRADQEYPRNYSSLNPAGRRGGLPADAIVGINLNDGRKIMFDLAVLPKQAW